VDEVWLHQPGVLRRQPFAVIAQSRSRALPWKLSQNLIVGIVGERAPNTQRVLAGRVDVIVDLSDDGAIVAMTGRVESIAAEVEATILAESRRVPRWKLIQDFE